MYAVAWHTNEDNADDIDVFPNVFPDFDMATDCVMYEIKKQYGDELSELHATADFGGKHVYHYGHHSYVIRKLFNFNPKGM